jgi:hypothetical protein
VLEAHFADHRHRYNSGAGEQHFGMVHEAIRKAIEEKHPRKPEPDRERPQRSKRQVVTLHNPGGVNDVYIKGAVASPVSDPTSNVEGPSVMPGYEAAGAPIGDEDD